MEQIHQFKVKTFNKISKAGLDLFGDRYEVSAEAENPAGIILRSQSLHDMEIPDSLLAIARAGAGVNNIPIDKCSAEGVVVFNAPGANANAVKELVLASMIMSSRNLYDSINWACSLTDDISKEVEKGKGQFAGTEIFGKTIGVFGLGSIGVKVANICHDLGMNVIGYDPYLSLRSAHQLNSNVSVVSDVEQMLSNADFITLHVPYNDNTKEMFNEDIINMCKDGAVLLNFSRNFLVNEDHLLAAIESGKLKQYITDFPTDKIMCKPGVLALPHLGASTSEAEDNCAKMAARELMDFIENGNITNSVNFPSASLGPITPEESRICLMTYGIESPVPFAIDMFKDLDITAAVGGLRGKLGYVLLRSNTFVEKVNMKEGVLRVRVIQDL